MMEAATIGHNSGAKVRCVYRAHGERAYTKLKNSFLQDPRLSDESRGMLARLLSLPEDWEVTVQGIVASGKSGRDKVYRMLKEAEKFGYVKPERDRSIDGKLQRQLYLVSDDPAALIERAAKELYEMEAAAEAPLTDIQEVAEVLADKPLPEKAEVAKDPLPEKPLRENQEVDEQPLPEKPDRANPQQTKEYLDKINNLSPTGAHTRKDGVEVNCNAVHLTLNGKTTIYGFSEIDLWAFNARMPDVARARKIVEAKLRGWVADRQMPPRPADWLQRALKYDKIDDEVGDQKVANERKRAPGAAEKPKVYQKPRPWD